MPIKKEISLIINNSLSYPLLHIIAASCDVLLPGAAQVSMTKEPGGGSST